MDDIFDSDIANTAKILKIDRLLLLKFRYKTFFRNISSSLIPQATVEVVYDWHKSNETNDHLSNISCSYSLSQSCLTVHGWKKAPQIVKISNKSQLDKLDSDLEIQTVFNGDHLKSLLIIPLCTQKVESQYKPLVLGLLVMQNYKSRRWHIGEIETGRWMAKQITSTFINQKTIGKVQSLVDERTAQLQVSLDVQAKLGQKLRNYLEELERVNRIKDEFIASLSDALKTPLSNMKMGIKMLKLVNKEKKLIRYVNILDDECEKEINLVNNLLKLQELQSNQLTIEPKRIDLKPLLDEFYNTFSQELHYQQKKLIIENQKKYLYTDFNSLKLIIQELITNAVKHSVPATDIILKIYTQQSDTIIKISNRGVAIPIDELENIFQPFYQGKHVENVTNSGTGLGLALVESLVHNLRGEIKVSSNLVAQSDDYLNTFTITFPLLMNDSN